MPPKKKNPHAVALGPARGEEGRAESGADQMGAHPAEERRALARLAALARWPPAPVS
jgi:hypothetical protein